MFCRLVNNCTVGYPHVASYAARKLALALAPVEVSPGGASPVVTVTRGPSDADVRTPGDNKPP